MPDFSKKIGFHPWKTFAVYTMKDDTVEEFRLHSEEEEDNERQTAALEMRSKGTHVRSFRVERRPVSQE